MARKLIASFLSAALALTSPGGAWLWAAEQRTIQIQYDPNTQTVTKTASVLPGNQVPQVPDLIHRLQDPALSQKVPQEQIDQAVNLLQRYQTSLEPGASTPEAEAALKQLADDLSDKKKDPALALAGLFDHLSDFARKADALGTYVDVLDSSREHQVVAVRSRVLGRTLFIQEGIEIGPKTFRKTIRRPDAQDPRKEIVDAIILETEKGAAQEQRVVYNRRVHLLLKNLKKIYYDQPGLLRQINDTSDAKITPEARKKLREVFDENQAKFPQELLDYIKKLDAHEKAGTLDQLDWKELEAVQRRAMRFYNENQLDLFQKIIIVQITAYFSQVTNTSPKQKKDGTEALDASKKDLGELQGVLNEIEKGNLEGYGLLMRFFGITKLSDEDRKYITPEIMTIAAEAFADIAYAVKAKQRLLQPKLTGEEQDAAIEESQQWLRLAQTQLQTFEMQTLVIQLERLKSGSLRDHLGLDDPQMKAEASALVKTAKEEYLKKLAEATFESKRTLLKQSVATFYLTWQNASHAFLYDDTLQERVRTLAAKAGEMKALYLALEFEKVKDNPEFKGKTAMERAQGGAYQVFLEQVKNGKGPVSGLAKDLDRFAEELSKLSRIPSADAVRAGLVPLEDEFRRLAKALGYQDIPDTESVRKEAQRQGIKQGKLFAAAQNFSANMRVFDMMNELDLYLRKYASPEMVTSESDSAWSKFASFKWMDSTIDWVSRGFGAAEKGGGLRQGAIDLGMKKLPWTKEAFQKLKGNEAVRKEVLRLLALGRFSEALAKIQELDPEAARKALREYEADKAEEDPYEGLDFDSFMSKGFEDKTMVQAQGVAAGLFGHLQRYILGYTAAGALYDAAFMTVATAGLGQLLGSAGVAARMSVATTRAFQAMRIAETTAQMSRMARMWNAGLSMLRATAGFATRVVYSWERNFRTTLEVSRMPGKISMGQRTVLVVTQFGRYSLPNAAKFTAKNMAIMGLASGGIQWGIYEWSKDTSQYRSGWDAMGQGMLGGAAFGAKAGALMLMSPVPATAFRGTTGVVMRGAAEMPGPVSGIVQGIAKVVPAWSETAVAQAGPLQAFARVTATATPGMKLLAGTATWGWAMAEGAAKYWLAAEFPKEISQLGSYLTDALSGAIEKGQDKEGATSFVQSLAASQEFSLSVAQVSWLMVPVSPMYRAKDVATQTETSNGFSVLIHEGKAAQIEMSSDGTTIEYQKPIYQRSFMEIVRGEKTGTFTVSAQWRQEAARFRMGREFSTGELLAVATAGSKSQGEVMDLKAMVQSLGGDKVVTPTQVDGLDLRPGQVRITNESVAEAKRLLETRLSDGAIAKSMPTFSKALGFKGAEPLRAEILGAQGEYVFRDPKHGEVKVTGKPLRNLKEMAFQKQIETLPTALEGPAAQGKTMLRRAWDALRGRPLETEYQAVVRTIAEKIEGGTPREKLASADARIEGLARERGGTDKLALDFGKKTLRTDAAMKNVEAEMRRTFADFHKGRATEAQVDKAIDGYVDIWEEGAFGRNFGSGQRIGKDGSPKFLEDGRPELEIPPEHQFKDLHGHEIQGFRSLQKQVIRETLKNLARNDLLNFGQQPTSGGKTLSNFAMIDFMDFNARKRGREGVLYLTTSAELAAQAMEDYVAFFGRKPSFEITTYGELMARIAQAKEEGSMSPMARFDLVCDEFDQLAMGTPLSLGSFNGRLNFAKIDPFQTSLRRSVKDVMEGEQGLFRKFGGRSLDERNFDSMFKKEGFGKDFDTAVARAVKDARGQLAFMKTDAFRETIDPGLYPEFLKLYKEPAEAKRQIQVQMIKEYRQAMEVAMRKHGGLEGWVKHILSGAYQLASQPDQSKVYMKDPDPKREGILQLHNDTAYDSLDTAYRSAAELKEAVPLTLDFDTVAITNFRELIAEAKEHNSLLFATSGTAADVIRKVLINNFGFKFTGEGTVARPLEYVLLKPQQSAFDIVVSKAADLRKESKPGARNTTYVWVESLAQLKKLMAAAEGKIDAKRISLRVYPGSALMETERWMKEVRMQRNMEAFEKGEVDLMVLVGRGGFRGLNNKHDAYKGGKIPMYVIDPQNLPVDELTQLVGRTAPGRTPGVETSYIGLVSRENFTGHKHYAEALVEVAQKVRQASENGDAGRWQELRKHLPAGKPEEEAVLQAIKDPNNIEAKRLFDEILDIRRLREGLTSKERAAILKDPEKLHEFTGREKVLEVIEAVLQRHEQREAISSSGLLDHH